MEKKRVLVLTDISTLTSGWGEPDDTQSMIRLLTYVNELDVEGLVATYTCHSGHAHPEYLHGVVDAYAGVEAALRMHDPAYPRAEMLHRVVKCGSHFCGMEQVGEGKDTEASEWIIAAADKEDVRPLWILVWGAPTDLAQALWKVSRTRSREETERFLARLRVYAIGDQYDGSGPWIKAQYPELFYITAGITFRGMYRSGDEALVSPAWVREHITQERGTLGALYPVYDGGDPWGSVQGVKEGDSPSLLYLVDPHHDPEQPEQPHWGGQFIRQGRQYVDLPDPQQAMDSVARWRGAYQADFSRRMAWCKA
jgi:hypothetical protein